jgi:predicted transcriptional regulator
MDELWDEKGVDNMAEVQLGIIESRFADMIWEMAPVSTSELVKRAETEFSWKRTTTHTVIKRLCNKGLFENNAGIVKSLITREEFYSMQSIKFVEESFDGSLPAFVAAFSRGKKLSKKDADAIKRMIDESLG